MIKWATIVCLVLLQALPAMAMESFPRKQRQQWCYECSLLCLGSVASLQLSIEPSVLPQTYRIVLQGKGSGLIGWLNGDRHQYYESLVQLNANNTVSTAFHLHHTEITHNSQRIQYGWKFTFNELPLGIKGERLWGGDVVETAQYYTADDVADSRQVVGDFLSALFGFMVDGSRALEVGLQYKFLVFYRGDNVALNIDVIDDCDQDGWQCRVRSDRSCLPGGGKEMIFYCDDNRVPLAVASPVLFGGVRISGARCVGE